MATIESPRGNQVGAFVLSYTASFLLIAALIYFTGVWSFLANSRLLDLLIDGGIIQYHDTQAGMIPGIPDTKYYLMSQDPVKWLLILLAGAMLLLAWFLRSLQFHDIGRIFGISGRYPDHARAYFLGVGVIKLLPYYAGAVATVLEME